jgi:menaquinone-dependent protoporphyrinogen oxidase
MSDIPFVEIPAELLSDVDPCDAVIFGSGVYDGSWTAEATEFVQRHAAILARKPVWLFSVGSDIDASAEKISHEIRVHD